MEWCLRPATDADLRRVAEIISNQRPQPVAVDEIKRQDEQIQPDDKFIRMVLETEDGLIVGFCMGLGSKYNKPGRFHMNIRVDEPYWNQGAGSLMYRHVEDWARGHGATHLTTSTSERHQQSRPWAERRGFVLDEHIFESTLDLTNFDPTPFEDSLKAARDAGIHFTTLAALGDDEETFRRYFDWLWEVTLDIPGTEGTPKPPFELYAKAVTSNPHWSKERAFLAMDGDRIAGFAELVLQKDGSMYHSGTGIDRAYRGRRLSTAMKMVAIKYAMEHGVPYLRTNNNSKNAPILAVNRAFGYKPEPGHFGLIKQLG